MPIEKAEDGREHDAEAGDQQRVEQPDQEDAAVGVGLAVGDQRLIDAEARGVARKPKPLAMPCASRLALALSANAHRQADQHREQDELIDRAADLRVVDEGAPARHRRASPRAAAYRIGGAYWMPPLVHSRLRPRLMPSFEPVPTLRSKTSP